MEAIRTEDEQWFRRVIARVRRGKSREHSMGAAGLSELERRDTSESMLTSATLASIFGIQENLRESAAHVWVQILMLPVEILPDPSDGEPVILYDDDQYQHSKDDPRIGCLLCNMSLDQGWDTPCPGGP